MTGAIAWMGWQECAVVFVIGALLTGLAAAAGSIILMVCRRGRK